MAIILTSDALEATIAPERGADIVQVVDRATGTPLFAESPTGLARAAHGSSTDSMAGWMRGYPGGWQLLGRTDATLWDIERDPPALLAPGVRVRFVQVPR